MMTKSQSKRVAKEYQTLFLDPYVYASDYEVVAYNHDVVVKFVEKAGVFHNCDSVDDFCRGRKLNWYVSADSEGYLQAVIF